MFLLKSRFSRINREGFYIASRISVSVYFAVFVACVLVLDSSGLAAFALFCALIHECGHIAALYLYKVPVHKISFRLFGIEIVRCHGAVLGYRQEIALALAGCAANLAACVPAAVLWNFGIFPRQSGEILMLNLLLCLFNLLPIGPLDGGQALEAALCQKVRCETAEKIVNIMSVILIIPLVCAGVYLLKTTGYNLSLIAASVYLAVALVIKNKGTIKHQTRQNR